MSRIPSDATALKNCRAELRRMNEENGQLKASLSEYRGRASKAEAEVAEWKRRFDILLSREPSPPTTSGVQS
jgi:predicted RNase H-like nuclease (RuvC/YqgF family)